MKTFLSIDWDYFVDATYVERMLLFPDGGNENLASYLSDFIWSSRYADSQYAKEVKGTRAIEDVGVLEKEYRFVQKFLLQLRGIACGVAESHAAAYEMFKSNLKKGETCRIVNIDFHHDLYENTPRVVDCGNWLSELFREGLVQQLDWVACDDSDELPNYYQELSNVTRTTDLFGLLNSLTSVDGVFLCRSGVWSPPHLDVPLIMLKKAMCKYNKTGQKSFENRYTQMFKSMVQQNYDQTKEFRSI